MTDKTEEYIEAIYEILEKTGEDHAHTNEVAEKLGVSAASVTEMLRRLSDMGLVSYRAYYGAGLTPEGMRAARDLMHKHETMASFLRMIGVPDDVADADACQLEHHISPDTLKRLRTFVEYMSGTEEGRVLTARFGTGRT